VARGLMWLRGQPPRLPRVQVINMLPNWELLFVLCATWTYVAITVPRHLGSTKGRMVMLSDHHRGDEMTTPLGNSELSCREDALMSCSAELSE
jgi:hypothetical protein